MASQDIGCLADRLFCRLTGTVTKAQSFKPHLLECGYCGTDPFLICLHKMDTTKYRRYRFGQPGVNGLDHIENARMGTANQYSQRFSCIQNKTDLITEIIWNETVLGLADEPFWDRLKIVDSGKSCGQKDTREQFRHIQYHLMTDAMICQKARIKTAGQIGIAHTVKCKLRLEKFRAGADDGATAAKLYQIPISGRMVIVAVA